MSADSAEPFARLAASLQRHSALAIAVSGGVDSLTLATVAQEVMRTSPLIVHAISPAVPAAATERVRGIASSRGWQLREIAAGEFADPNYLSNPYDRCYHCKSNLYRSMRAVTDRPLASGTNVDDLSDYRPGLQAASERNVVHPFVDANIDKRQIRGIARLLQLDYADLPAQPCLASRIETGIPIRALDLSFVDGLETRITEVLSARSTVRVRVRAGGVHVEVREWPNPENLSKIEQIARSFCAQHTYRFVEIIPYRQGSAFVEAI